MMLKDLETMTPYGAGKLATLFPEELGGIKKNILTIL